MAYNREPKREWPCEPQTLFKQANILFRWVFSLHREICSFLPWQISLFLALSIPQLAGHVLKCHSCCSKEQALQPHVPTSAQPLYIPALSRHHIQPREGTLNLFTPLCSFLYSFLCVLFIFSLFFWVFLVFFAVGLFKCPIIMQVHPNLGCICPSHSLAKQITNIFIKYYLQNGDKDLQPLKATCLYTTLVNNPPSSILNEFCVSHTTQ